MKSKIFLERYIHIYIHMFIISDLYRLFIYTENQFPAVWHDIMARGPAKI